MAVETTYDSEPTLNDSQVLGFCKKGYLIFEGVVSDETNRRTLEFVDGHSGIQPTGILREKWFVDDVIKNPQAAGAVRSLLGRDWIIEPDFDVAAADYSFGGFLSTEVPTFRQQFRDLFDSAEMLLWLRGESDKFRLKGGQGWPIAANEFGRPYGIPAGLG